MAIADANRVSIYHSVETTWGEVPSTPSMTELRITSESLEHNKDTAMSAVIRADRMVDDDLQTGFNAAGGFNFELATGQFNNIFDNLLAVTTVAINQTGITSTVASAGKTFTRSAGDFVAAGFVVGQWVKFVGHTNAGNNGLFLISAVSALVITCATATGLVNETSGAAAVTATGRMWRNGTLAKSLLLEKRFNDISQFVYYSGCRVDQMTLSFKAASIITGGFTFLGKQGVNGVVTVAGSSTPATAATAMTASANVGTITKGGAALAAKIKQLDLTIKANLRQQDIVGQLATGGIGYGRFEVTGKLESFFEDATLYTDLLQHNKTSLSFRCTDVAGNVLIFTIPACYFTKGTPAAGGVSTDITLPLDLVAVRDSVSNAALQIDAL